MEFKLYCTEQEQPTPGMNHRGVSTVQFELYTPLSFVSGVGCSYSVKYSGNSIRLCGSYLVLAALAQYSTV